MLPRVLRDTSGNLMIATRGRDVRAARRAATRAVRGPGARRRKFVPLLGALRPPLVQALGSHGPATPRAYNGTVPPLAAEPTPLWSPWPPRAYPSARTDRWRLSCGPCVTGAARGEGS